MASYVVIDLETTGLDYGRDDIIEIAAVKVQRGLVIEEYSTLIKPHIPVGDEVASLTGISNEMLENQPHIEDVLSYLTDFIGDSIPVAHNAEFDRTFLTRYWPDPRQWIDSITLAQIVYPCQPSYSLAWLSQALEIEHKEAHRALSDALATADLFIGAVGQFDKLGEKTRAELMKLSEGDESPLGELIRQRCQLLPGTVIPALFDEEDGSQEKNRDGNRVIRDDFVLDVQTLEEYLGDKSQFKERISGFEERPQQLLLAKKVAETFNNGGCLLAEAGTGTGKSLAYLLPSVLFSLGSGKQVAVSTHTRNLQEQLINKDIPMLSQLLDRPVHAAVLKGRSNYLCKRLYRYFSAEPDSEMRYFLMRMAVWRSQSKSGDGGELSLTSYARKKWSRICASKENCAPFCPFYHKNACFVQQARAKASKADILVLNHSLLIANAAQGSGFLPELPMLVIDEAQHLENATEDQLTSAIDFFDILNLLSRYRRKEKNKEVGVLPAISSVQCTIYRQIDVERMSPLINKLDENIEQTVAAAEKFYDALDGYFADKKQKTPFLPLKIRITEADRGCDDWQVLKTLGEELAESLAGLAANSFNVLDVLREGIPEDEKPEQLPKGFDELYSLGTVGRELAETIRACMSRDDDNYVAWAEYYDLDRRPTLNMAPVDISRLLCDLLYEKTEAVVMTSATLSTGKDFSYFKDRVGLNLLPLPPKELTLQSPFYYEDQALFTVVNDLPDWSRCSEVEASAAISEALIKLLTASRGRAIVLFTSHYQLRNVYYAMKDRLAEEGVTVLAHGISGHPSMLLQRLKNEENCCILGAASFWEGVDVIGEALSLIVVVRLPFWPPNTPLAATRMERIEAEGRSSFAEYSLPMALIRFKQGFGRLIRSDKDSGVFCVLDRRIVEKNYGARFVRALPEMKKLCGSTERVAKAIEKWLGQSQK